MRERGYSTKFSGSWGLKDENVPVMSETREKTHTHTHTHTHHSLKTVVLISTCYHKLCSFKWERKSKGFEKKRSEDFLIFRSLKRDLHHRDFKSSRSKLGSAPFSIFKPRSLPVFLFSANVTALYPTHTSLKRGGHPPPLCVALTLIQAITNSYQFYLNIFLNPSLSSPENDSGPYPGVTSSTGMTCFSPDLHLVPGNPDKTNTWLNFLPEISAKRLSC